ncbi:tripartite tricarboxylate transporter substrate binding protein [Paracoccus sp. Z330]|uniref:Tripartite tricarboxylate transporter substrate binding protein n=1 Tax=Paracoccus onchidii TaxID=3017813 RepID=A0ABT4ZH51_9RHOB|nr:tripartite tricarboxylate transporter substrate binding protein [Paracoccus onchidii]MDB6178427.1 tripartite tricarboxylate transporter substrate binding protein [Paracoccus onchidii]
MYRLMDGMKLVAAVAIVSCGASQVVADDFPSGPIEVINNSKPGGGSDIFLRFATEAAAEILDTSIIHLSKTGGVATNTLKYVQSKPADGHTLFIVNAGTALTMMSGSIDMDQDDIIPLVRGTVEPEFIVVQAGRFEGGADFIEYAKSNPIKQAGTKVGGNAHVNALIMKNTIGMAQQTYVPFEKSGEIVINVINGNVDVALLNHEEFASQAAAGQVDVLAVLLPERLENMPEVPTGHEIGLPMDSPQIRGLGVRAGTPEEVVDKLEAALLESMKSDTYVEYLKGSGQDLTSVTGRDAFGAEFKTMYDNYQSIKKELLGG